MPRATVKPSFQQVCRDVAETLEQRVSREGERPLNLDLTLPDLTGTAFQHVCDVFHLSPFERRVLLLCAATQLHPAAMLRACAVDLELYDSRQWLNAFLSPYVLQQWFGDCDLEAFLPASPLLASGLIQLRPGTLGQDHRMLSSIQPMPGTVALLQGRTQLSPEVAGFVSAVPDAAWLGSAQLSALDEGGEVLHGAAQLGQTPAPPPVLNLYGPHPQAALEVAGQLAAPLGLGGAAGTCWQLHLEGLGRAAQQGPLGVEQLLSLLARDLTVMGGLLVMVLDDTPGLRGDTAPAEAQDALGRQGWSAAACVQLLCARLDTGLVLVSSDPLTLELPRPLTAIPVERATPEEQAQFWGQALEFSALQLRQSALQEGLEQLATQFSLSSHKLRAVAQDARGRVSKGAGKTDTGALMQELWEGCKRQGRAGFQGIAERITAHSRWDQLVLPDADLQTLHDIVAQVQHRHQVYRAWNYGAQTRGLGLTALFSGTSGGGKTFAAEVLAGALNLDLFRIDLSSVSSKWIGETEKNLKRVFDAADEGGAILLFDEADSVFGKRGDAVSSNDRYANLTTNYLLQRMESYRGLAILTTNFEGNIDSAFMRRIRFTVRFREPDQALRLQLWQRAFPPGVPVQALDYALLARTELTGANIRTVAVNATFLAAARQVPLDTGLVQEAMTRELRRQGRFEF